MKLRSNLLLLCTAFIWGFAFVAQRAGMEHIGPFTFNGVRFALGTASLLPLIWYGKKKRWPRTSSVRATSDGSWRIGLLAGGILFIAASLQQIGLVYTTAGKTAFITCLYIVMVPLAGLFFRQPQTPGTWTGIGLATAGLYLLCVKNDFTIAYGDWLELAGAAFWTAHIILIGRYAAKIDSLQLACLQFSACSVLSMTAAILTEEITLAGLCEAGFPILYGGICSVGIAYTLQIVGQKHAEPAHAALILSMETVFGAIGGYLILNELLMTRELLGMSLMTAGMLSTQLPNRNR